MSDRGEYRACFVAMRDDVDIHAMSPAAFKLLWMLKLSLPATGIGVVYPSTLAEQVGVDRDELDSLLAELEQPKPGKDHGWIMRESNVVWIIKGLDCEPNLTSTNERKHVPFVRRHIAQLPRGLSIVREFKAYYASWFADDPKPNRKPTDSLSEPDGPAGAAAANSRNPSDRVSKQKQYQTKPTQSGDLDQERGAARKPPSRRRDAAAAPLAAALADLPGEAIAFLKRFYPRGKASSERRVDVAEQIVATLAGGTELTNGQAVRAYSRERLAAKCLEVLREGVRDPDKAIVVLLKKLGDTSDGSAPGIAEARTMAVEQKRVEREAGGELQHALAWLPDRPDVEAEVDAELEAMGIDAFTRDEDLAGDSLYVVNRRITRHALVLEAWRRAGAPIPAASA